MRADLILVCHAATAASRSASFPTDDPLDQQGAADAAAAGARFALRPERLLCAPSRAARQTAGALGFVLEAVVEPEIRDCDFGRWSGRPLADVAREEPEAFTRWMTDPDSTPHRGESQTDLVRRVGEWIDSCLPTPGRTVAVTHPAVIRAAVVHAIAAPPATFWHIDIGPLSRTWLRSNGSRWTLRRLED
jgi:broad specificity phosphatase PhoE